MKSKTVSGLLFSILSLWGSSAIAADFTFTVPYDFKDLLVSPTIRCFVTNRIDSSLTNNPLHIPYLDSWMTGHTDVRIPIDSFGNAKGTVQIPVDMNTNHSPHDVKRFMCRLRMPNGRDYEYWPVAPDYQVPTAAFPVDRFINARYKSGTPLRIYIGGAITQ